VQTQQVKQVDVDKATFMNPPKEQKAEMQVAEITDENPEAATK
jgi:hypothetical protein